MYTGLLDKDKVGFPAVHASCDFHAPLRFGDTADVELSISRMGSKSIDFRYVVRRSTAAGGSTPCAEGKVTCAVVDLARFAAIAIPDRVKDLLRDLVVAY